MFLHKFENIQTHYQYDTKNDVWKIRTEYQAESAKHPGALVNQLNFN